MKRIIQKTAELIALIENEIKAREKFYATNSKHMYKAEARTAYENTTELLRDSLNKLNDLICELNENA